MTNLEICADCWYLQHGWYPGEAPREPDDLRDAARDADPNARCKKHRAVTPEPLSEAVEATAAQLLIELAFLVPRGTDLGPMSPLGSKLAAYKQAVEARATRPSPTCATCKYWDHGLCANGVGRYGSTTQPLTFGCTLHEPAPPAQDGGRP